MPVSVREWLSKSAPADGSAVRLVVVHGSGAQEHNAGRWIASEIVDKIKTEMPMTGIAEFNLPDMHIASCSGCYGGGGRACAFPCDRNDGQKEIHDTSDELVKIQERILDGDILLLVADSRWGGLNHHVQRFIERMNSLANRAASGRPLLKNKVAGIVVVGDSPLPTAGQLMMSLNAFGFAFPQYAYVAWSIPRLATHEACQQAFKQAQAVHSDAKLVGSDLIRFAKLLKGI